jgi:hypothetical protein
MRGIETAILGRTRPGPRTSHIEDRQVILQGNYDTARAANDVRSYRKSHGAHLRSVSLAVAIR